MPGRGQTDTYADTDILYGSAGPRRSDALLPSWDMLAEEHDLSRLWQLEIDGTAWTASRQVLDWAAAGSLPEIPDQNDQRHAGPAPIPTEKLGSWLDFLGIYFSKCGPKKHLEGLATIPSVSRLADHDADTVSPVVPRRRLQDLFKASELAIDELSFPKHQVAAVELLAERKGQWFLAGRDEIAMELDETVVRAYSDLGLVSRARKPFLLYMSKEQPAWGFGNRQILGFVSQVDVQATVQED